MFLDHGWAGLAFGADPPVPLLGVLCFLASNIPPRDQVPQIQGTRSQLQQWDIPFNSHGYYCTAWIGCCLSGELHGGKSVFSSFFHLQKDWMNAAVLPLNTFQENKMLNESRCSSISVYEPTRKLRSYRSTEAFTVVERTWIRSLAT